MANTTAFNITPSIDVATQVAENPGLQSQLWQKMAIIAEENEDYYMKYEGAQDEAIIGTITDTSKGDGSYINFRTEAGFYQPPHFGGQFFESTIDFEPLKQGLFGVQVRRVMHGTSIDSETDEFLGMVGELSSRLPKKQGEWMGRLKSEQIEMMLRTALPTTNIFSVNGVTIDSLNSASTLSWDGLLGIQDTAATQGGRPGSAKTDSQGNEIMGYTFISAQQALYGLRTDPNYQKALQSTKDEKAARSYFDGGWEMVNGIIVADRRVIDHDGWGPIGGPMNPKALLGNAISSSSTAITVLGGGDAISASQPVDYFRYFINNPYQFQAASSPGGSYYTVPQDSLTHYFLIVNPANSPAGYLSNGIGMYSYTTGFNNTANGVAGYSITTTGQLGPVNNGYQSTTIGSVTYNQGVWATALNGAGINTTSHPIGATIYQCNAKGQPFGFASFLGKSSTFRGYGMNRLRRGETLFQGGTVKQLYIMSTFGQTPRIDTRGRTPAAFILYTSIPYVNTSIPQNIV